MGGQRHRQRQARQVRRLRRPQGEDGRRPQEGCFEEELEGEDRVEESLGPRPEGLRRRTGFRKWAEATKKARKALGLTGFVPVGGKTAAGKALYAKAKALLSA